MEYFCHTSEILTFSMPESCIEDFLIFVPGAGVVKQERNIGLPIYSYEMYSLEQAFTVRVLCWDIFFREDDYTM